MIEDESNNNLKCNK